MRLTVSGLLLIETIAERTDEERSIANEKMVDMRRRNEEREIKRGMKRDARRANFVRLPT